jgi:CheY-like chemotaxis protein
MRLLHLEDDKFDIELTGIWCSSQWPGTEIVAVSNRSDYLMALRDQQFDGIVSDSEVSGLVGAEAVKLARLYAPAVPFVFLCGTMSDDSRHNLLAAGADAVVSKNEPDEVRETFARLFRGSNP